MADDAVTRKRRQRGHERGDHSLCRPQSCPDAPGSSVAASVTHGGGVRTAVDRLIAECGALNAERLVIAASARAVASVIDGLAERPSAAAATAACAASRELGELIGRLPTTELDRLLDELQGTAAVS